MFTLISNSFIINNLDKKSIEISNNLTIQTEIKMLIGYFLTVLTMKMLLLLLTELQPEGIYFCICFSPLNILLFPFAHLTKYFLKHDLKNQVIT